jgi:hypothetical protein
MGPENLTSLLAQLTKNEYIVLSKFLKFRFNRRQRYREMILISTARKKSEVKSSCLFLQNVQCMHWMMETESHNE